MTYLPLVKGLGSTADQCRELGIKVGDTIIGRQITNPTTEPPFWHEAKLKLLWIGETNAVWSVQTRIHLNPEWLEPYEDGAWTLDCRRWRKMTPNVGGNRQ